MRLLRLEHSSIDITVTNEAYEHIVQLVEAYQLCSRCERLYTPENPKVAINTCLACYLKWHASSKTLAFIGKYEDSPYAAYYAFLGPRGYVYLSDTHSPLDKAEQNNAATLKQWGFTVPALLAWHDGERKLHSPYWHIYGAFTTNSVVFLNYHEYYGDRQFEAVFLATKHGETVLFNKRKGEHRKLWLQAKAALEATKDARGVYHVGEDSTSYIIEDYHLYKVASELASAAYDREHPGGANEPATPIA